MKKIAFIVNNLIRGGMERVVVIVANKLIEQGHNVSVVLMHGHTENEYNDCKANLIDMTNNEYNASLSVAFRLKNLLADFDAIIINYYFGEQDLFKVCFISICYLYFPNKTFVVNHNNNHVFHLTANKKLSHYMHSNMHNVVSICEAMQKDMDKEYGFDNIKTIYNPIVMKQIESMMYDTIDDIDCKYILAAGRLDYQKNFPALVRAYGKSLLPKNNIKLVIIGRANKENQKEYNTAVECAKKLNIEDKVLWLGVKDNPFKYMKNALFLVMSSRYEGFGMVLAECLATGTPVISYDLETGPNEIIIHEHNGLLVKNQDEEELTKAIDRLYSDKELYARCKASSIESVQKFDINSIIKDWEFLIDNSIEINTRNSSNALRVLEDNYKNPHGVFSTQEIFEYIEQMLNYHTISDYLKNIELNHGIIDEFENNIYDLINQYCVIFKCNEKLKENILINTANIIMLAFNNFEIGVYFKGKLKLKLKFTEDIKRNNELMFTFLSMNVNEVLWLNHEIDFLTDNKWFKFGQLSRKNKIKIITKIAIKSLLPKKSIRMDFAQICYKVIKKVYKMMKKNK